MPLGYNRIWWSTILQNARSRASPFSRQCPAQITFNIVNRFSTSKHLGDTSSSSSTSASQQPFPIPAPSPPRNLQSKRPDPAHQRGQNISSRYLRLERSLRSKTSLSHTKQRSNLLESLSTSTPNTHTTAPSLVASKKKQNIFRGVEIPDKPKPPENDECCMSGCAICVYDLYEDSIAAYKDSISTVRDTLTAAGIPEVEWPISLQSSANAARPKSNVALSAFEEMERRLKQRRESQTKAVVKSPPDTRPIRLRSAPLLVEPIQNLKEIYEGLRWLLFSKR